MGTDIVVGIDGSEDSKRALAWAADEAKLRGARVRAVLCWSYLGLSGSDLGVGTTEEDARAAIQETVAEALDEAARSVVDVTPVNDLPVAGLLSQAAEAGLVVVGSRGRGGVKGLVLGSVSRTVVERSPVPVVVMPHVA
jgi:nucleotide-binding universal stress UspA family protein